MGPLLYWDYEFTFSSLPIGSNARTFTVVTRGTSRFEAEQEAVELVRDLQKDKSEKLRVVKARKLLG